jgi:hypothetical protein
LQVTTVLERLDCDAAGFFARYSATHAIGYDGNHEFVTRPQAHRIFIVLAYLTDAGACAAAKSNPVIRSTHAVFLRYLLYSNSTEAAF